MKICSKCNEEKELDDFPRYKSKKGIYKKHGSCIKCQNEYKQNRISLKRGYSVLPSFPKQKQEFHYCNTCNKTKKVKYFRTIKSKNIYETRCRECYNKQRKNFPSTKVYYKEYRIKNHVKHRTYTNKYRKNRLKNDPLYNLKSRLRKRTGTAFRQSKWKKNSPNEKMLCCSYTEAFYHIESQFLPTMSWDNRSEWHIDHIIPLSSAKTEEELIKLCHYTNLQPLWAKDNLKKGNKLNYIIEPRKP